MMASSASSAASATAVDQLELAPTHQLSPPNHHHHDHALDQPTCCYLTSAATVRMVTVVTELVAGQAS